MDYERSNGILDTAIDYVRSAFLPDVLDILMSL